MLRYCGSLFTLSSLQRAASIDTKKMIMRLRQESQLPLGTCRSALQATNWNFEDALVHLEKEAKALGMKKMESLGTFRKSVSVYIDLSIKKDPRRCGWNSYRRE